MAFVRKDVKGKDKDFFNSFGIIYENNLVEEELELLCKLWYNETNSIRKTTVLR